MENKLWKRSSNNAPYYSAKSSIRSSLGFTKQREETSLEKEVREGKCILMVTDSGEAIRVACVVAVAIKRYEDSRTLVQLGTYLPEQELTEPGCLLPGYKVEAEEECIDTCSRIFECFNMHTDEFKFDELERSQESKNSARYGIRTRYFRYVYHITMEEDELSDMDSAIFPVERTTRRTHLSRAPRLSRAPSQMMFSQEMELPCVDIFIGPAEYEFGLYAWLTPSEFTMFRSHDGRSEALRHMLSSVQVDEETLGKVYTRQNSEDESLCLRGSFMTQEGCQPEEPCETFPL